MNIKTLTEFQMDFNVSLLVKTPYVFLACGATVEQLILSNRLNLDRVRKIYPADERVTVNCRERNVNKLKQFPGLKRKVGNLNAGCIKNVRSSTIVLSIADDGHFASLLPRGSCLSRKGFLICVYFDHGSAKKRITVSFQTLLRTNTVLLFRDIKRLHLFKALMGNNSRMRILLQRSKCMLLEY